jgi:hypothetical protein
MYMVEEIAARRRHGRTVAETEARGAKEAKAVRAAKEVKEVAVVRAAKEAKTPAE